VQNRCWGEYSNCFSGDVGKDAGLRSGTSESVPGLKKSVRQANSHLY